MKLSMRALSLLVVVATSLALTGCGGGSNGDDGGGSAKVDVAQGRKLFQQGCKSCHALADADARGSFGPNLDDLPVDAERVKEQIERGGGGMPPKIFEGKDAETVANYVAEVAGK